MSSYLCRPLLAFDMFNNVFGSVPKCRCWEFLNNCISNITMLVLVSVPVFLTTVSGMAQQSLALYPNVDIAIFLTTVSVFFLNNSLWLCAQMEMLPFCKHLYQGSGFIYRYCLSVLSSELMIYMCAQQTNILSVMMSGWNHCEAHCHFVEVYNIYFCVIQLIPPVNIMIKHKFQ
jgi:hypothetical protein